MQKKIMKSVYALMILAMFLLPACGNSGPSKKEAGAALDDLTAQFAGIFGQNSNTIGNIDVEDIKCKKESDDIYSCDVLVKFPNGQEINGRYRFTKLNDKWRAEPQ